MTGQAYCSECGAPAHVRPNGISLLCGHGMSALEYKEMREPDIEAATRALWELGNARIGFRPWQAVAAHYRAEAQTAVDAALGRTPTGRREDSNG